jgi:hypothetical protein
VGQLYTQDCANQTISLLVHSCNILDAHINHGHRLTRKTHHGPILGEAITFPIIIFSMHGHGACTQMSFCLRTPKLRVLKFPKLKLVQLWKPIIVFSNLQLK